MNLSITLLFPSFIARFDHHSMCIFGTAVEDMGTSVLFIVALVLTICAVVFQIIGLAAPYWVFIDGSLFDTWYGLWTTCIKSQTATTCTSEDAKEGTVSRFLFNSVINLTIFQKVSISIVLISRCKSYLFVSRWILYVFEY